MATPAAEPLAPALYPELKGRVVAITGAAAGLGLAIAEAFAGQGARLLLMDRDAETLEAAAAGLAEKDAQVVAAAGSVTEEAAVEAGVAAAVERFGRLDVMIANAGIGLAKPTLEMSLEEWRTILDINMTGVFHCGRAAARRMIDQGGGVILNMSSMYGLVAAPNRIGYCGTKAAVSMMTEVWAIEWAEHAIRVNAIAPTYVRTQLVEQMVQDGTFDLERLARRIPLGRLGSKRNIADLALFLASDRADFITGQTVPVDGGWTAYGYL